MRSTDFSRAPARGRTEAMLLVEAPARRGWRADVRRRARRHPGLLWCTPYRVPGRRGLLLGFADRPALEAFAPSAADGSRAGLGPGVETRVHLAEPGGYTNGAWRAEDGTLRHIERFTATARETERGGTPPEVAGGPGPRRRRPRRSAPAPAPRSPLEGGALFVGATHYRGVPALLVLARTWYPMVASMRRMRGYVWHTVYLGGPFVLGTIAFFETRDDLLVFARTPEHRRLMRWVVTGTRWARAGYIRLLGAEGPAGEPAARPGGPARPGQPEPDRPDPAHTDPAPRVHPNPSMTPEGRE